MLTCFSIRFTVVAVIAALAVSAASIPRPWKGNGISIPLTKYSSSELNSNESVNIDGLKSRAISHTTKLLRGLENYERNIGTIHPYDLKQSGSQNWKRAGAELDLAWDKNYWYATIWVGTPPKLFTVQIDTGSSDLIIPASNGDENCKSHDHLFNAASSVTAKDLDQTFQAVFTDGATVDGKQYTDNISISDFTADKQTIGVATTLSATMAKSKFPPDGVLGLSLSSAISNYPASSLLETLVSEGKLADGVFAFKFTKSHEGEMYIGGVNEEQYTGDITFVDVHWQAGKGFWMVTVEDIRVNNKPVLAHVTAIIDTGASHIFGDHDRVSKLHQAYGGKAFKASAWYTFRCDHFPDVTLTFGGKPFTIPADELNLGPVTYGSSDCFSGILGLVDPPFWTIGCKFLELFYTVFKMDSNKPQVGFAHLAESSELEDSDSGSEA